MRDEPLCAATGDLPCAESCSMAMSIEPLELREVLDRFETEAERGVCDTGRYRCPFFVWGKGPPLLFIHGLADDYHHFLWLSAYLAPSFRCIGYDLPMGGNDGARLSHYVHQDLADDVFALLDHVDAPRCYVFATGYGSTIALRAAYDESTRLPRTILQGAFASRPLTWRDRAFAWLMSYWPGPMRRLWLRERTLRRLHHAAFSDETMERWQFYLECTGKIPLKALGRHARLQHATDLSLMLPLIRQPTLLVQGQLDRITRAEETNALLQRLQTAGYARIPGAGYLPSLSHPEELAKVIHHFLTPPEPGCSMAMDRPDVANRFLGGQSETHLGGGSPRQSPTTQPSADRGD